MLKKFNQFKSEIFTYLEQITKAREYYAHTKEDTNTRETLIEHTKNIENIFLEYNAILNWDELIDRLIFDILQNTEERIQNLFKNTQTKIETGNLIKQAFLDSILYHDFGKINPEFQKLKMKNPQNIKTNLSSEHAIFSAVFYILSYQIKINTVITQINPQNNQKKLLEFFLNFILTGLSLSIKNHHDNKFDNLIKELENSYFRYKKEDFEVFRFLPFNFQDLDKILENLKNLTEHRYDYAEFFLEEYNYFSLYLLIKLSYSILTRIDYLATSQFYYDLKIDRNKVNLILTEEDIIEFKRNFYNISYNQILKEDTNINQRKNINDLNELRTEIALNVKKNINQFYKENIFYLQSPTGSGKTNLSFLCAVEILSLRKDLNKIFYVLPFNTLSDQIYDWLSENFSPPNKTKIFQIHSYLGFLNFEKKENQINESEKDARYGKEKELFLDYLFLNFPVLVMSHVRFFGILKTCFKKENYFLSQIHNSIVILDEIQSYPPKEWDKLKFFIENFAKLFNICFIIMSATLPKLHSIRTDNIQLNSYVHLLENANDYFNHSLFKERVKFEFDLLEKTKAISDKQKKLNLIYEYFLYILKNFNQRDSLKIVFELITKKSAFEFYEFFKEKQNTEEILKGIKFLFLSGTILPPFRKKVLNEIRTSTKAILFTTQVIEAGIDLDFDLGFKDMAILDSEEQLAGRINRNAKKNDCYLYIFHYSKTGSVYKNDYRYKILTQEKELEEIYKNFLLNKNFDAYYSKIFSYINSRNKNELIENLNDYLDYFKVNLDYYNINEEFKIIDSNTISIFIPIEMPVDYFTKSEIEFLKEYKIKISEIISGKILWDLYLEGMQFKDHFFKKIFFEKLISILNKFIINIYFNRDLEKKLKKYINLEYLKYTNILYLEKYENIYSLESGLDIDKLGENIQESSEEYIL